jgi:ABC-2 type transport system ATP-binding protein
MLALPAIQATHLRKCFGAVTAVADLSFSVPTGTITALLGGNGAGKTTTLGMLLGLILPTSGSVTILGHDMRHARFQALPQLNFSSPYIDLPGRLTVQENLTVYAHLYGIKTPHHRIAELTHDLQIGALLNRPYGRLSAGQKTRVTLAKALLNKPAVLLLDEPTASLDPDTADWVRGYLQNYQRTMGATIMLASHNMAEVERIAQQAIIMRNGVIAAADTPANLVSAYGRATLEDVFLHIARTEVVDAS